MTILDKYIKDFRSKSINGFLGKDSAPIRYKPEHWTELQQRWMRLRDHPVDQMTIEEMRFMIGQEHGAQFILPFAILELRKDILAEGDMYPGDLLNNILRLSHEFWKEHTELKQIITVLIKKSAKVLDSKGIAYHEFLSQ